MTGGQFNSLEGRQQHVLLLAIYVRNALEDFHVDNLTDAQMKVLNQTIRKALYDADCLLEPNGPEGDEGFGWLVSMIPPYWELPGEPMS